VRPDPDLAEQLLVRAAKDADPRRAPIAREEKVVLRVDEDTGDAREIVERTPVRLCPAVEHVHAVGPRVGDVHERARDVDVRVVEPRLRATWDRDEAGANETHVVATAPTSALHQA
jgi:hypothetical protein